MIKHYNIGRRILPISLPPISLEEFCNIIEMGISKDKECNILAEELLKPYVYNIIGDRIFLTENFSIKHCFGKGFSRSDECLSAPIPIGKGSSLIENSNKG